MTTRYGINDFSSAFFGVLHETGRWLYDQGLDPAHYGTLEGIRGVAGDSRIAVADVGESTGRRKGVLEIFLAESARGIPAALAHDERPAWHFCHQ